MNKKMLISRLFSFTIFGLFGLSIISCEDISGLPSNISTEISSELSESNQEHIHEWNEGEIIKEATCIVEGQITYSCTGCDEVKSETISALGHNEVIDDAISPTCTETGLTEGKHCERCNEVFVAQEEVAALGHNYESVVTEPTCVEQGYTIHTCENCGDSYADTYTDALGHSEVVDKAVSPTCTTTGLTEGSHCDRCDEVLIAQEVIPALGHSYGDWEVPVEPGCESVGTKRRDCEACDYYEEEEIAALGHINVVDKAIEPTCTETGLTQGSHCDRCKEVLEAQEVIPTLGHSYGDWEVTNEPGCESVGTKRRDCEECDHYEEEEIAALGHVEVIDKAVSPTCEDTGLTEGKHCDRCKEVLVAQEVIPALGHSYGDWEVAVEPGCESEGTKRRDCEACDHYEEEKIAALGHVEVIDKPVSPTCEDTGLTEGKHCDRCKEVLVAQEVIPALGHSYGDWEVTNEPGCESVGTKRRDCEACDHYEEEEIAALGHNFIDYVCSVCGYEYYSKGLVFTDYGGYYALTNIGTATDTDIVIPSMYNGLPVTMIEFEAFKYCSWIKSVTIGNNVTSIGISAFEGCSSLESIIIPDSVTNICEYAFFECISLTNVTMGTSVITISGMAFSGCISLISITIPNSVKNIEYGAFDGCNSLMNVVIPNTVTNIGDFVFAGCTSLENITIPNSVTNIGNHAFESCSSLISITIPDALRIIDEGTFQNCISLTNITIPNSVRNVIYDAFTGCSSLTDVYYTGTQEKWNNISILSGNSELTNATIHFAKEEINYTEELIYELSSDETYYSVKDIGTLTDSNIIIPETYNGLPVKNIEFEAFKYCSWLTSVTIGNNVTSIGIGAFEGCSSLESVIIPNSVTNICEYAFFACVSLTNVIMENSVITISGMAFSGCSSLTSITIPNSVKNIEYGAFYECTSLTDVYYTGTEEQWNSIIIGNDNEILLNATIHYNYSE